MRRKRDSVQIQSAMAHSRAHSHQACASGRKKFDLNLRAQRQICHRKQAHTDIANIDPKCFNAARFGEYTDRGVEQLTFSSPPVLLEIASEKHWQKHEDKVAHGGSRTEITKGSVLPHRWDTSSCEYNGDVRPVEISSADPDQRRLTCDGKNRSEEGCTPPHRKSQQPAELGRPRTQKQNPVQGRTRQMHQRPCDGHIRKMHRGKHSFSRIHCRNSADEYISSKSNRLRSRSRILLASSLIFIAGLSVSWRVRPRANAPRAFGLLSQHLSASIGKSLRIPSGVQRPTATLEALSRSPLLEAGGANSAISQVSARPRWM
jgi:hypothetical protein